MNYIFLMLLQEAVAFGNMRTEIIVPIERFYHQKILILAIEKDLPWPGPCIQYN
jgi:hypothetical protein